MKREQATNDRTATNVSLRGWIGTAIFYGALLCATSIGAGDALPPSGGDGVPPAGEVFHDFGITGMEVRPAGEGLFDVDIEVTIVPEAPPVQDLQVQLLENGIPVAEFMVPTFGLPPYTCCVSTCAVVSGYTFSCSGECVTGEAPRVCRYTQGRTVTGLSLSPGSELRAVADPFSFHVEVPGDAAMSNSFTAIVPGESGGDVFHDFGITDVRITPAGEGLFDVDIEVTIVPEGPTVQDIDVQLLEDGVPVAELQFPTFGLPPYSYCVSTCTVVTGYTFSCGGECRTADEPRVCQYTHGRTATGLSLSPGSEFMVIAVTLPKKVFRNLRSGFLGRKPRRSHFRTVFSDSFSRRATK